MSLLQHHYTKLAHYLLTFGAGYFLGFASSVVLWQQNYANANMQAAYYGMTAVIFTFIGLELGRKVRKK